jgi:nucleotide-binding universal stress UspA family protein
VRGARQYAAERHRQVKTYALPAVQRLQAGFPDAQVTYQIVDDSPYFAITDHARMWNADLIVVGSHNSSAIGRFFLGSVSQSLANHANCSVRICRETPTQRAKTPRVLIGFDGSPASSAAVDAVAARAWPEKTQVRVVTVGEPKAFGYFASRFHHFAEPAPQEENGMEALPTWLRNIAERACKQLRLCGLDAEAWGFEGDPKKVLLDVLTEWNADCIFVGSSGQHERKNSKYCCSKQRPLLG